MTDTTEAEPLSEERFAEYEALVARATPMGAVTASPGILAVLIDEVRRLRVASAAVVPAADRAALRDRIAAAVQPLLMDTLPKPIAAVRADEVADAVLSVLPAPADRAAASTAETAAALGMTPTDYRAASHRAAEQQIREAASRLYADAGLRVLAALDAAVPVVGVAADTTPAVHPPAVEERHTCHDQKSAPGRDWECQWCSTLPDDTRPDPAPGPLVPAQPGNDTKTPVAYRSPGGLYLYCTRHSDDVGASWTPLDSDDLPEGGLCAQCGADVLIPQQPKEA